MSDRTDGLNTIADCVDALTNTMQVQRSMQQQVSNPVTRT